MSYIESPDLTTLRFIESWSLQDPNRLAAELVSVNKETNRKADNYFFEIENDLLIDPETGKPILDFIQKGVEYEIAEKLQNWAIGNDEGLAYWVSPRLENKYPCEKVIIHRLLYTPEGKKVVMNSTILFDADLENPEELRATFFTANDNEENIFKILSWVESVSRQKIDSSYDQEYENNIRYKAAYFAEQIRSGVDPYDVVDEMRRTGFLGKNPISCPSASERQSFSEYIDSRSTTNIFTDAGDGKGPLQFRCKKGHLNTRPLGGTIPFCTTCGESVAC